MHSPSSVNLPLIVISIMVTAVCWGVYGPLLQWGHADMGSGRLRPFICVGIAYLVVAIFGPILVMMVSGMEMGTGLGSGWTSSGIWWSFLAGVAGALGALGMILAFNFGGKPHYVPPLIFGLAPVVNTFFTLWFNPALRTQLSESPVRFAIFGAGLILVAVGAVVVLVAAPKAAPKKTAAVSVETREAVSTAVGETDSEKSKSPGAEQSPAPDIMPQGEAN